MLKISENAKRLYQLIISRLDGDSLSSEPYQTKLLKLVERGIGGFIIFGGRKTDVIEFIEKLRSLSEIPLFMASDVERGVGQQIDGSTLFPCQMAMAAATNKNRDEDRAILKNAIQAIAYEAIESGINMPLIPVLDINQNPDNPIICTRAFSDNPEDVSWFGVEYIKILENAGLISCAKHFPGHGDTSIDSHIMLPLIGKSYKALLDMDIIPFKDAVRAGVSSIMVGHLSIPALDNMPASLSKKVMSDLLRKYLGFDGLVVTDALNMNALKDIEKVSVRCLNAGADILLHPVDPDMTVLELSNALKSGELADELIDEAFNRILKAKAKTKEAAKANVEYEKHRELSSHITDKSISLIKNSQGVLPIGNKGMVDVLFAGDNEFFGTSVFRGHFKNVSEIADSDDLHDSTAVIAIFTSIAAWKGRAGIDEVEKDSINETIRKAGRSVVISFGNPYVLSYFKTADILIAAYEATEQAQRAVIKCLEGTLDFQGRCPVRI